MRKKRKVLEEKREVVGSERDNKKRVRDRGGRYKESRKEEDREKEV